MSMEEKKIVLYVLKLLDTRAGFGDWWYSIDQETRKEIIEEITNKLGKKLEL